MVLLGPLAPLRSLQRGRGQHTLYPHTPFALLAAGYPAIRLVGNSAVDSQFSHIALHPTRVSRGQCAVPLGVDRSDGHSS